MGEYKATPLCKDTPVSLIIEKRTTPGAEGGDPWSLFVFARRPHPTGPVLSVPAQGAGGSRCEQVGQGDRSSSRGATRHQD